MPLTLRCHVGQPFSLPFSPHTCLRGGVGTYGSAMRRSVSLIIRFGSAMLADGSKEGGGMDVDGGVWMKIVGSTCKPAARGANSILGWTVHLMWGWLERRYNSKTRFPISASRSLSPTNQPTKPNHLRPHSLSHYLILPLVPSLSLPSHSCDSLLHSTLAAVRASRHIFAKQLRRTFILPPSIKQQHA